jgi:hypothetical protein
MKTPDLLTVHWRKSTHSGAEGGDCVEAATLTSLPAPSFAAPHPEDEAAPRRHRRE